MKKLWTALVLFSFFGTFSASFTTASAASIRIIKKSSVFGNPFVFYPVTSTNLSLNGQILGTASIFSFNNQIYLSSQGLTTVLQSLHLTVSNNNGMYSLSTPTGMPYDNSNALPFVPLVSSDVGFVLNGSLVETSSVIPYMDPQLNAVTSYFPFSSLTSLFGRLGVTMSWESGQITFTATPAATLPPTASSSQIIATAEKYLKTPYVWAGSSPSGFDCSGFVQYVFEQLGATQMPRIAENQLFAGTFVSSSQLQPGDLVFFSDTYIPTISHVGIYIGNNQFIEASSGAGEVIIASLSNPYYQQHYYGAVHIE